MKIENSSGDAINRKDLIRVYQSHDSGQPWYKHPIVSTMRQGMLFTLPILIFLTIVYLLFKLVFNLISPISFLLIGGNEARPWYLQVLTLMVLLGIFLVVGLFAQINSTRALAQKIERKYFFQMPLYSVIRETVQQFSGLKKMPFSQAVLVDPYNTGVYLTGFISEQVHPDLFTVFVPTAPNPINGNLYHVPRSKLVFLAVAPEVAMRSIVGMGSGSSNLFSGLTLEGNKIDDKDENLSKSA